MSVTPLTWVRGLADVSVNGVRGPNALFHALFAPFWSLPVHNLDVVLILVQLAEELVQVQHPSDVKVVSKTAGDGTTREDKHGTLRQEGPELRFGERGVGVMAKAT
jgi:hypothetical protein